MRIWLTGASGFVGSGFARVLGERHGHELLTERVELLDPAAVRVATDAFRPDAVVHCAILNDFHRLVHDRRAAWDGYVGATRAVVDAADRHGAQVVLISTDWVVDGEAGGTREDDPPNPINVYGFLKAASELVVEERAARGAVARIAGVQGVHWARPATPRSQDAGFGYLALSLVDALAAGERFTVWEGEGLNAIASPTLSTDAADLVHRMLERDRRGIHHCVGGEAISRRGLALRTAAAFGLDASLIDFAPPPPGALPAMRVPRDTSLDGTATAAALGVELPDVDGMLARLRVQHATGVLA